MKVSFVIPTHANPSLLKNLLTNIQSSGNWPNEVVIVSDHSDVMEIEGAVAAARNAKWVGMNSRSGFSATVNEGVRASSGDIVVLVNTDITFLENIISGIGGSFGSESDLGVLGFKLYLPNGLIQHGGGFMKWDKGAHIGHHMDERKVPVVNRVHYPVYVTGALLAFRRSVYDKIGGFDEDFVFGCEDAWFCIEAWLNGFSVKYDPNMSAVHAEGMSRNDDPNDADWVRVQWERSRKRFANRCVTMETELLWNKIFKSQWEKNKTVSTPREHNQFLFIRTGMIGDNICGTEKVVTETKKRYPDIPIHVRTDSPSVFCGHPDVASANNATISVFGRVIQFNTANGIWPTERMDICHLKVAQDAGLDLPLTAEFVRRKPRLFSTEEDWLEVRKRAGLVDGEKYAVVHQPVTHWKAKTLPSLVWAEVQIGLKHMGMKVVVVGSNRDMGPFASGVIDLRGRDNIQMLHQLIAHAAVFVGVDSGPFHVAQCTDTPGVVVFTCYDPKCLIVSDNIIPVQPTGCHNCYQRVTPPVLWIDCPENKDYECTKTVSAGSILKAVEGVQ